MWSDHVCDLSVDILLMHLDVILQATLTGGPGCWWPHLCRRAWNSVSFVRFCWLWVVLFFKTQSLLSPLSEKGPWVTMTANWSDVSRIHKQQFQISFPACDFLFFCVDSSTLSEQLWSEHQCSISNPESPFNRHLMGFPHKYTLRWCTGDTLRSKSEVIHVLMLAVLLLSWQHRETTPSGRCEVESSRMHDVSKWEKEKRNTWVLNMWWRCNSQNNNDQNLNWFQRVVWLIQINS